MSGAITWTELMSQPAAWEALIERLERPGALPDVALDNYDEVLLLGSGTSYYLALAAADWIRRRHGVAVRAVPSCEILLDGLETVAKPGRRRLAIGFSRSGESSELLLAIEALRRSGFTVLAVGCTEGSSLMRLGDVRYLIHEGQEDGLVMLRSFTSMLIAVQYLFGTADDRAALRTLPLAGRAALVLQRDRIRSLANRCAFDRFVFLGSGSSYPLAEEASLKVQEMSISTSEAFHSLEYRHGPKATADANTLVALFALPDAGHGLALARDLKDLGVTLLVVGPGAEGYREIADLTIGSAPGLSDGQASALTLLPLQIVAYDTAMRRGRNPDAPVNLSKVVVF